MKNKEKFKNEITDIICDGDIIAVDKETRTPVPCSIIACDKCLFYSEIGCSDALNVWANQEYKEPNVISYSDRLFLNFIKADYEYIVRDKNGELFVYAGIPIKYQDRGIWLGAPGAGINKFSIVFPMIKWEDAHPWKISDLKKLKVVKNY
jgi:hypothetical protein